MADIEGVVVKRLKENTDSRGFLAELYRQDEDEIRPRMAYISYTRRGQGRGPHEHRRQTDFFAFAGPGDFVLHLWDNRKASPTFRAHMRLRLGESRRCTVLVPPGVVHGYTAVSEPGSWSVNLPDALFKGRGKRGPIDEIRHEDNPDSPFQMEEP